MVRVLNQPAGNPTTVEMHWCTAPDGAQWASVTFETVLAYRWSDFDLGDPRTDRDQFEFGLIRITESELVDQLLNGADRLDPAEWYGSSMARAISATIASRSTTTGCTTSYAAACTSPTHLNRHRGDISPLGKSVAALPRSCECGYTAGSSEQRYRWA